MFRILSLAAIAAVIATPAFASGATCSSSAASKFQPVASLKKQLESEGMKVSKIKTEGGCYEAYVTDKSGKKLNMAFNAETLAKVDNPEAGEN
ncbi:MAG TPA: PepSY domain-containing protein [Aestuariivirga sp.]|nr:PepSY domain-containing protein [Aestuariivirga sp.]